MKEHASFNRCYRLLWSGTTEQWKPVPETARTAKKGGRGKAANTLTLAGVLPGVAMSLFVMSNLAAQPPPQPPAPAATQLPTGGNVVAGQATISQSAIATAANMVVNQNSQRAIIDWSSFNLGSAATVQFVQPNAQSVILNRVLDPNPSQIFGRINANGQVFLTNPYGVYFSPSATVDVGGLVATTYDIRNADFMSGYYRFERTGGTGRVVNEGTLRANAGGYIALLAPEVQNSGVVLARAGTVAMAAGDEVTLTLADGKSLSGITTTASSIASLVENKLAVLAPDGQIILSAVALNKLQAGVIKNSGSLEATSLTAKGGKIVLEADEVELAANATIDVSGRTGGGTVLMGGDWQGSGTVRHATQVTMAANSTISANATDSGDGGKVVLWSNVNDANSTTTVAGSIFANAGPNGGNGGQIETSGYHLNVDGIQVATRAPQGKMGEWLLDPADITISSSAEASYTNVSNTFTPNSSSATSVISNVTLSNALNSTSITVTTVNNGTAANSTGNITISKDISWNSANTLTLIANDSINGTGNISMTGGGSVVFNTTNTTSTAAYSGVISGNGSLSKQGVGILTLSGQNSFTGSVNIQSGILKATAVSGFGSNTNITINDVVGAGLEVGIGGITLGSLTGGTNTTVNASTFGLTVGSNNVNTTYAGALLGSNNLTKTGTGSFALTGNSSSFTGNIVNSGTGNLVFTNTTIIGNGTNEIRFTSNNTTLELQNVTSLANPINSSSGFAGNFTLFASSGNSTLSGDFKNSSCISGVWTKFNVSSGATLTLSGNLNTSTSSNLSKVGDGKLVLSGNNSLSPGNWNVSKGVLTISNSQALGKPTSITTGNITLSSSTVAPSDTGNGTVLINSDISLLGNLTLKASGAITGNANISLGSKNLYLYPNQSSSLTGNISGPGDLYLGCSTAQGTWYLSGANTFTCLTVSCTTLKLGSDSVVNSSGAIESSPIGLINSNSSIFNNGNAVLDINGHTLANSFRVETGGKVINSFGNATLTGELYGTRSDFEINVGDGSSLTLAGKVSGGSGGAMTMLKTGNGTLTFQTPSNVSKTQSIRGQFNVTAGQVVLNSSTLSIVLPSGPLNIANNATLQIQINPSTFPAAITNNGLIKFTNPASLSFGSGTLTGNGSVQFSGSAPVNWTRSSNYTGSTTIDPGATLNLSSVQSIGNVSGPITDNGTLVLQTGSNLSFNQTIIGSGNLAIQTIGGTVNTLSILANNTYTGTTTLGTNTTVYVGSYLNTSTSGSLGTGNISIGENATLTFARADDTAIFNNISSSANGTLAKAQTSSKLNLAGNLNLTGRINIYGGTLQIDVNGSLGNPTSHVYNGAISFFNASTFEFSSATDAVLNGNITQNSNSYTTKLIKNSSVSNLTLNGNNNYTNTVIESGTLYVGSGGGITAGKLGTGTVVDNASLVFNHSGAYFLSNVSGNITGTGNVTVLSTDNNLTIDRNITLTGSNSLIKLMAGSNLAANNSLGNVTISNTSSTSSTGTIIVFSGSPTTVNTTALWNKMDGALGGTNYKTYNATLSNISSSITGTRNFFYRMQPSINLTEGNVSANKVYDGTTTASNAVFIGGVFSAPTDGDTLAGCVTGASYATASAGENKSMNLTVSVVSSNNNWVVTGYRTTVSGYNSTANITQAPLTVKANDDARFVTFGDTVGYAGASYSGFVPGETLATSGVTGNLTITRSNSNVNAANTYTGVLVPSGLSANNYSIIPVNGNYTIVPAQQLIVRVSDGTSVYGNTPNLTVASATYLMPDNVTIVNLTSNLTLSNGTYSLQDGASGAASFDLGLVSPTLSSSNRAAVGIWNVGYSNLNKTGVNFNNMTVVGSQTITPRAVNVTTTATNKEYDGNTNATVVLANNLLAGDVVNFTSDSSGVFASKNAGNGITVTVSNITVTGGADAGNYILNNSVATTMANITKKSISLSGLTASDKVYDATTTATVAFTGFSGLLGVDDVQVASTGTFNDKNVGSNKTVTVTSSSLGGQDAGNYQLSSATTTANITAKAITVSGLSAVTTKVYDGTTVASTLGAASLQTAVAPGTGTSTDGNVFTGDVVSITGTPTATYNSKDVATAVNVSFGGISLTGAQAGNYVLTTPSPIAANITKAGLVIQANDDARFVVTTENTSYAGVSYKGLVNGENVSTAGFTGTLNIARSNAGSGLAGNYNLTPSGVDAGNYNISFANGTYTIVPAETLLIRVANSSTVYGTTAPLNVTDISYLMSDNVTIVNLTSNLTETSGLYTVQDGASGSASFNLGLVNATLSASGRTAVGSWSVGYSNLTQTSANFNNVTAVGTQTVTAKALTVTAAAANKVYDGSANATMTLSSADAISGDNISYAYSDASFVNKNVGSSKTATATNITLGGADAGNYAIQNLVATATANITAKTLTITNITADNKAYDGCTTATTNVAGVTNAVLLAGGMVSGDNVTVAATGSFVDKSVGTAKVVNLTSTYSGTDAGNYNIVSQVNTTADITAKTLTISGITAADRVYDGGMTATINTAGVTNAVLLAGGLVSGDTVTVAATGTFADKNVGTAKVVTLNSTYGGADMGNYDIVSQANTTANITAKALTISGITAANKVYDGCTSATVNTSGVNSTSMVAMGLVAGDTVTLTTTGEFANKHVGDAKVVMLSSTYAGADVGNYNINSQTYTQANVTPKALNITGITAADKVYDGNLTVVLNTAAVNSTSLVAAGLVSGDNVTVTVTGAFADKNANTSKVITLNSTYAGTDLANYNITGQATTTANITAKALTITGITATDKVYDGTVNATLNTSAVNSTSLVSMGLVAGDNVTLAATGEFADKNVNTSKVVTINSTFTGTDVTNYNITAQTSTTANITAKALTLTGLSVTTSKVYDGTNVAVPLGTARLLTTVDPGTGSSTDGKAYSGDVVNLSGIPTATYNSKDVATAANVSITGLTLTGTGAGNYVLSTPSPVAATITRAPLLVRANDDARFVTQTDTAGYAGVSYNGFVNNENATTAGFSGTLAIARSDSTNGAAGNYTLTASGLSASNYNMTYQTGTYTIVPAETLLVRVADASSVYGSSTNLSVTSARYLAANNATIVDLSGNVTLSNGTYTVQDGASGSASFNLGLSNVTLSQSGHTSAGIWSVGFSNLTQVGLNFNTITAVGTQTVTAKPLTVSATGVNRVYDGTANATVTLSSGDALTGDNVSYAYNTAIYGNKNVGVNKAISVSNLSLSGSDATNYQIQNLVANATANTTARTLNITGITANNKAYDGNTTATVNMSGVTSTTLIAMGLVAGDDFSISTTGVFSDASVGRSKTVTLSSTYSGADVNNYLINPQLSTLADITGSGGSGSSSGSSADNDGMTSQRALSMIAQLDRHALPSAMSAIRVAPEAAVRGTSSGANTASTSATNSSTSSNSAPTSITTPSPARASSTGVLPVAVIEEARMSNLGMTFEQQPNDIHIQLTTAPAMLPPPPTMLRFSGNFKIFMVMNDRGEMVSYQGAMVGKRMVILADTDSAKRLARVDMQTVLAAAITSLGSDQPIMLSEIESVVMDLR